MFEAASGMAEQHIFPVVLAVLVPSTTRLLGPGLEQARAG